MKTKNIKLEYALKFIVPLFLVLVSFWGCEKNNSQPDSSLSEEETLLANLLCENGFNPTDFTVHDGYISLGKDMIIEEAELYQNAKTSEGVDFRQYAVYPNFAMDIDNTENIKYHIHSSISTNEPFFGRCHTECFFRCGLINPIPD